METQGWTPVVEGMWGLSVKGDKFSNLLQFLR